MTPDLDRGVTKEMKDKIEYLKEKKSPLTVIKADFWYTYSERRGTYSLFQHYTQESLWRKKRRMERVKQ